MVHQTHSGNSTDSLQETDWTNSYREDSPTGQGLGEDVDKKMQQARERLDELRNEQERVEREERKLERLRVRQEEFLDGSRRAHEELQRSVTKLDREVLAMEHQMEAARTARETLSRHLQAVRDLAPERWPDESLEDELERALAVLDNAHTEHERCNAHLGALGSTALGPSRSSALPGGGAELRSSIEFLKAGFFFTLPLIAGLIALALVLITSLR